MSVIIKIRRNEYEITSSDLFLDNGSCIQLMTQSKEKSEWGWRPQPTLTKKVIKQLKSFAKLPVKHGYGEGCELYKLDIK